MTVRENMRPVCYNSNIRNVEGVFVLQQEPLRASADNFPSQRDRFVFCRVPVLCLYTHALLQHNTPCSSEKGTQF